ncbi:MAG: hypothetical protein AAGL24_06360 [Pseudomonadota bacterium]
MIRKILNGVLDPSLLVFKPWKKFGGGSFGLRLDYDIFSRPHYAFCTYYAARQACALGIGRISVAEFGVAGGRGLIELESLAAEVEAELPVKIDIYGFDTGEGLPDPVDYRDLPYIWQAGFYKMDQDALKRRLKRSKLILGNVKDTVPTFIQKYDPAPLAAAFLDLDFWSSTLDAMKIFEAPDDRILPRVFCYCDDVISSIDGGLLNDYVGQLAAIKDYNDAQPSRKMTRIAGLERTRRIPAKWNDQIYVHHSFDHRSYNTYVHEDTDRQLKV